jgi:hypothetical protein
MVPECTFELFVVENQMSDAPRRDPPLLLVPAGRMAVTLSISPRHARLTDLTDPIRIGLRILWRVAEIEARSQPDAPVETAGSPRRRRG